jgi:hypothetical protein
MYGKPGAVRANKRNRAGDNQQKKDGARPEHSRQQRQQAFEQPVLGSVTRERGQDTSNFTDGEIAGADHKHDDDGHLKDKPTVSEPRRRTSKSPDSSH